MVSADPGRKLSGKPDPGGTSADVDPAEDQRSLPVISNRNANVRPFAGAVGLFDSDLFRQIQPGGVMRDTPRGSPRVVPRLPPR